VTLPRPITLGRAWDFLDGVIPAITSAYPELLALTPAGEVRRIEPLVSSIVLVACAADPDVALEAIASSARQIGVERRGGRRMVGTHRNLPLEIILSGPDDYGSALLRSTGSASHLQQIDERASLDRPHGSEAGVYASANLAFIVPELRHGTGEIEAAAIGRLPALIEQSQMRGDLHMHTDYSDGRDSVEDMVEGCHRLGYEYMAITDHSSGAAASRTLDRGEIAEQRDVIDGLRAQYPGMTILHGVEVDILPDGRLDYDDRTLEQFDIVLASLHERVGHDGARLTERSLAAIRHPLVNVLCHPANQLVGHTEGYDLDFEALYSAAIDTGTALEIDGAPSHMDLDGDHARAAAGAGVTFSIDSDCHRVEALGRQMGFGVGTARRGWVEPHQVLNSRSLAELREFIAAKRRGRR
jgi:DNA polymerase (family 10)